MHNPDIGIRAFEAVRAMSRRRGTSISREVARLGLWQPEVYRWGRGQAPNAANLELLCLAGYDVIWILTGEEIA
jgi:hypothetical protein